MRLRFDWVIVLENLRRGIMVTDPNDLDAVSFFAVLDEWKAKRKKG